MTEQIIWMTEQNQKNAHKISRLSDELQKIIKLLYHTEKISQMTDKISKMIEHCSKMTESV
jgi:PII-like signaling protein